MAENRSKTASAPWMVLALAPLFATVALCYAVGEFYPFSSFPMYSKFEDRTYLVYLRSPEGEALPTVPILGLPASALKKRYGDALQDLKKKYKGSHYDWSAEWKTEAGVATLAYLKNIFNPGAFAGDKLKGVRLVDLRIRMEDGKLKKTEEVVGTVD